MMYQRFSDRMAYSEGHFIDLPNRSRFVSLRYSLLELQDNLKVLSRKLSLKATKAFLAVLGNPMNNFCTEYQVDGEGVYRCSFSLKDFKRVRDYSRRKYFAVTVASVTIIAIMFSFIFPGQPIGRAASYFWTQTDWSGGPDSLYPNHAANQTNWAKYSSKDANVVTGYAADGGTAGQAKLTETAGSYAETSDTDFNETNLVGEWSMDEGTGSYANDTSGNGNNGTLNIGATGTQTTTAQAWTNGAAGKFAGSLNFDGVDDYVDAGSNSSLNITNAITVSAWINPTVSGNSVYRTIFAKRDSASNTNYQLYLKNDAGANQGRLSWFNGVEKPSSYIPAMGVWTHIAATVSGGTNLVIYANGESVYSGTIAAIATNSGIFAIGRPGAIASEYFNGSIDDIRIYNTALTQSQIQGVMANAKGKADVITSGTGSAAGITLALPPAQVTGLTATAGNAQVALNWTAPANNGSAIMSYNIYRGATSGSETLLLNTGSSAASYTNTGLTNGNTYYYKISAVNGIGEGSQSAEANATPQCTVVIGTQTWMCYNLNIGILVAGSGNQGTSCASIQKYCYSDTEANCTSNGGLYQWNQAMCGSITPGAQGICPSGFHIPTDAEFKTLVEGQATAGCESSTGQQCDPAGTKLKPGGTSGFEGVFAGSRSSGVFSSGGTQAYFWSSTESGVNAWGRDLFSGYSTVSRGAYDKANGSSVRCLKN